jgi:putative serine protease PepD
MTEQSPPSGPERPEQPEHLDQTDDTERLTGGPGGGSSHRYAEPSPYSSPYSSGHSSPYSSGHSSPYSSPGDRDDASFGGLGFSEHQQQTRTRTRPGNGVVAGLLVAALLVGGLGGLAGAAGFTAVDDLVGNDAPSGSSAAAPTSSSVVNRKDAAPAADSAEAVARSVLPSVVKINVAGQQEQGSGSGIVIGSDGEILTNNHVVAVAGQAGRISVSFNDGTAKKATVVGTDPLTDLAVIKAQGVSGLQPASIGRSKQIDVGENVVAIGSPFGLEATVTSGIVSALNRPVSVGGQSTAQSGQDTIYPAIQTDAAINPGNSGGPLVDMNGDVIGINSSIRTASSSLDSSSGGSIGLGFAIPVDQVWPVVQQLRRGETPTHARLGVSVTDATSSDGLLTGAGVESVNNGSAAQKAGLARGDVVTKVDDDVITGSDSLVATIRGHRPGDTVRLTVVEKGNKTKTVTVTLDSDEGSASS